ncbi:MAG TPA: DUF3014 domain-containing protein [Rhodanobacter sp.]
MNKQASVGSWVAAVVVVLAIVGAGGYLARKAMHGDDAPATMPATATTAAMGPVAKPIEHPIEQAQSAPAVASTVALPALGDSDASVRAALAGIGGDRLTALLVPQRIIERTVATVDALPRHEALGTFTLPARVPKGRFLVDEADGAMRMGEQNSERYAPYMRIVEATDPQALVTWYVHAYPLFQQAYQQLGYPKGYFNDRLIVAIDDMLAAPELAQAPELTQAKAFYIYADPALEARSTGQKLMMRVGPANEAIIKAKLRAIRVLLVGQGPAPAAAATMGQP